MAKSTSPLYYRGEADFSHSKIQKEIPVDKINLTPALIPDIARQVIEKAKRIGDEEESARKAVEEYRRTRGE